MVALQPVEPLWVELADSLHRLTGEGPHGAGWWQAGERPCPAEIRMGTVRLRTYVVYVSYSMCTHLLQSPNFWHGASDTRTKTFYISALYSNPQSA